MSEVLLHVIREQPDDDLARLACADWLEEQGKVRPSRIDPARRSNSTDCRRTIPAPSLFSSAPRRLLAEHEVGWLGEVVRRRLVRWTFRRGFCRFRGAGAGGVPEIRR